MIEVNEKPTLDERYLTATNTSDMTMDAGRTGQGDVIGAAGMVRNRLGMALWHLRAAFDKADKPRKKTPAEIAKRAAQLKDKKGHPDPRRAKVEAMVEHASAMRELVSRLPGRNQALGLLQEWATFYGVEHDLLSPALFHWLAPQCPACDGLGKLRIPDTPALSAKNCVHCNGAGTWPEPLGAQRIHDHMKKCLARAKTGLAGALYG